MAPAERVEEHEPARDSSPPGSKANPLELPAEPEVEESGAQEDSTLVEVPTEVDETPAPVAVPNGNILREDFGAPTIARTNVLEAQTASIRQAGSSTAPESDVAAGQSQPLQTLVGVQPNGIMNGGHSAQTEIHERDHVKKELPPVSQNEAEKNKKKQNLFVRTLWTLIMISGFLGAK